jgi:hypothetical protein
MSERVDFSLLKPIAEIKGDSAQESRLLKRMANEAEQYLLSFAWCKRIKAGWFGWGVGGVCAVFFFEIVPAKNGIDRWLWVVVGDLPSAYLVIDGSPRPLAALKTYVELMQEWVQAVQNKKSTDECIPVSVPATIKNARLLERRLAFIKKRFLE